ncbi:cupin domain-containing protein [Synechococcus sp. PCC 7336]|uniref:cupin domain-containing protein n=1 Tax=Synechococcus sp. PCC 7336 TaxID=195250 RepID=UPI000345A07B|nr:cupin domain-containing protein [Synechococcus sp. PCC 7336]
MSEPLLPSIGGENFAAVNLGPFAALDRFTFEPEGKPSLEGKVFLKQVLALTGAEISLNKLPPRRSMHFYHKHHHNEEIYIFLGGRGEFQVDNRVFEVSEGTVVRVDCAAERCMRSTSDEGLYFATIQVRTGTFEGDTIQDGIGVSERVRWVGKQWLEWGDVGTS